MASPPPFNYDRPVLATDAREARMEGDVIMMRDIFVYGQTGVDEHGKIIGRLRPTGIRPKFMEELQAQSIFLPATVFGADRFF